jgi:membrane protein YdbS with pleckstrin-like domain
MTFPRRLLDDDESLVIDLRPHWSSVARPGLALVASLALALFVQARVSAGEDYKDFLLIPALALVLVVLVWFVVRYARWASSNLAVTTDRVVVRSGVVARKENEVALEDVGDVTFSRTLGGRLLGVGTLVVESVQGGREVFAQCPRPSRVAADIRELVDAALDRAAEGAPGHATPSPLVQLEKLDELRRRGVISQAEFDVKKAQLLDRL